MMIICRGHFMERRLTDLEGKYGACVTGLVALWSSRQYQGCGFINLLSCKFLEFDESHNTQYVSDDDTLHVRIMKITLEKKTIHITVQ